MSKFRLPPLKDATKFEEFICDLFNAIENTNSYTNTEFQIFGVKGQNQKGIDVFSYNSKTVIQCKVKNPFGNRADIIRKTLIADIDSDLEKSKELQFTFNRFIFASTFGDDSNIQEYLNRIQDEQNFNFTIHYWGWETLCNYVEEYEILLNKYFPEFKPKAKKNVPPELPEGAIGKDLSKFNYMNYLLKRYAEWKKFELDRKGEKFNYGAFNKSIMKKFKGESGLKYIPVVLFEELVSYLQGRIDKTVFGRNKKAQGDPNYSTFEKYTQGITE